MCGRFVQVEKPEFYAEHFGAEFVRTETHQVNYNVAPTTQIYSIVEHKSERVLTSFRWGLVPHWAKDLKIGSKSINARSETASTKPMFRTSFANRRCLIPVDGFYEWERKTKGKLPHFIFGRDNKPLPVAGLWSSWHNPETEERVLTATLLTGKPNRLLEGIHDRMPVIVPPEYWNVWLDPSNNDVDSLNDLMDVYPAELMAEYPVSTLVNKVANNTPDLIVRLETPAVDGP
jgi:putative SOS response-associated peptidase YedK